MRVFSIDLVNEYQTKGGSLDCYLADFPHEEDDGTWKRPAIIVVPGGAYSGVSNREGESVALEFLSLGFHTFVLKYRVGGENGAPYPEQLIELAASVDYIKKNAKEWRVNPNEVFVVGFSAGGHLTGNLAVAYDSVSDLAQRPLNCKPTGIALCYPVITQKGHAGSFENLLYGYSSEEKTKLVDELELHKRVTENTPPTFLWAMAKDRVRIENNLLLYAQACAAHDVDIELHVYPQGHHGSVTGRFELNLNKQEYLKRTLSWTDDCASFFRLYCEEEF